MAARQRTSLGFIECGAYYETAFLVIAALKVRILSSGYNSTRQVNTASAEVTIVILRGM